MSFATAEKEYASVTTRFTPEPLTPEQTRTLMEARTALLWAAPFFATIMYERAMLIPTFKIPTLATDGRCILFNPTYFGSLSVPKRVFGLCHEIAHMVYEHCLIGWRCQKMGHVQVNSGATVLATGYPPGCLPYNPMLMNVAQDFHINALLVEAKVGQIDPSWLFNDKYTGASSSVDVYADLWQNQPPVNSVNSPGSGSGSPQNSGAGQSSGSGQGTGDIRLPHNTKGSQCVDEHLAPGSASGQTGDEAEATAEATRAEWLGTIAKAAQAARLAGKMPGAIERLVGDIMRPAVDWRDHIRGCLARALGGGGYDWRRSDRNWINRHPRIYMPARSGNGAGTIVIVGDTSGSITGDEMRMVLGCVVGILEDVRPKRVVLLWCDTRVTHDGDYDDPADVLDRAKPIGGGGTAFEPPFVWCERNGIVPDSLIYVTDMYGSFPSQPPAYPVLWASISTELKAPFGEVISIPR